MSDAEQPSEAAPEERGSLPSQEWLGRVIEDRYRVIELLGEGGMGAVYLAEHVKLGKRVALKVIRSQFAGDGEVAERFAREAMASAKLDHPHVASALDYGTLPEGGAYLVMQFARGRSLRAAMEVEGGVALACTVGGQIADALSAAHAHRIVHRDLKPENVILEPREGGSELVKVLDFGIARIAGEEALAGKSLTRIGTVIGTPGYMAPEQALGESVDERADLYALGVLIWEMVARRPLFPEDDFTAIVTRQLTSEPERLSTVAEGVPRELDDVVARLLSRSREERPQRAIEVRDLLARIAMGATYERAVLSGEMQMPTTLQSRVTGATAQTMHAGAAHPRPSTTFDRIPASLRSLPTKARDAYERMPATVDVGPLRAVPKARVVAAAFGTATLAMLLVVATFSSGGDASELEAPPGQTVVFVPGAPVFTAPAVAAPSAGEEPAPEPPPPPPTVLTVPTEYAADVTTLLDDGDQRDRTAAATRLQAAPEGALPPFVVLVAQLEMAERCNERRDRIRELGELGDARALATLHRFDELPRRGCGFLGSQDCHRCMRSVLRRAIQSLSPQ